MYGDSKVDLPYNPVIPSKFIYLIEIKAAYERADRNPVCR